MPHRRNSLLSRLGVLALALAVAAPVARAQAPDWSTGVEPIPAPAPQAPPPGAPNMTVVPRSGGAPVPVYGEPVPVKLVAQITADGQPIDQGLVWRIFQMRPGETTSTLLQTLRDASPVVKLTPGDYAINAAFGKAHLTKRVSVKAEGGAPVTEQFVINAGGLRVAAKINGADAPPNAVTYSIYSDRDQTDARKVILADAKPGLIIRLNSGIYHIVSRYGDANATVASDVTVEAGKLTEAMVAHTAAKATFKLVQRAGGEAIPDTQWVIQTPQGEEIKESVGALPSHILAPGTYTVIAKSQGKAYQREFTLENNAMTQVEVIMK